jgi:hypothetical protein
MVHPGVPQELPLLPTFINGAAGWKLSLELIAELR